MERDEMMAAARQAMDQAKLSAEEQQWVEKDFGVAWIVDPQNANHPLMIYLIQLQEALEDAARLCALSPNWHIRMAIKSAQQAAELKRQVQFFK